MNPGTPYAFLRRPRYAWCPIVLALLAPQAPKLRLPTNVAPIRAAVELTLDPDSDSFAGNIALEVEIQQPTQVVWLHARKLAIKSAALVAGTTRTLLVARQEGGFLALQAGAIPSGPARLEIAYTGEVSSVETEGIFRQKSGGDWYVYTQFEPTSARRAFPCFDEPSFKIPWQLTVHTKPGVRAFSNSEVTSQTTEADGGTTVRFAETPPLPSYLVALAVGPLDAVDAGRSKGGVPLRILVPRGRGADAKYAALVTAEVVDALEAYFGTPLPYDKLDSVSVPRTVGFAAMENAGLITYTERLLLATAGQDTLRRQRSYAQIAAHEIAHHWFGDLVTLAWWDDVWLNEAFATWMANKVLEAWKPEWEQHVGRWGRPGGLAADRLLTARQIRQPIECENDIVGAFDGITYQKGAAVLRMFESWAGKERFRRGVQRYIAAHAHKTATSQDFIEALAAAVAPEIAPALRSFLEQPGIPVVKVTLACDGPPRLLLSQARAVPVGRTVRPQTWSIPVCARWGGAHGEGRACTLLIAETGELPLATTACPDWAYPNPDAAGYYVSDLQGDLWTRVSQVADTRLTIEERVALVGDVQLLLSQDSIRAEDALALVERLRPADNLHVLRAVLGDGNRLGRRALLDSVEHELLPGRLRPRYARFVRKLFGAKARELGFASKADEDEDVRLIRPVLVAEVAGAGEDKELRTKALNLAQRWLGDRTALDPEMVSTVLGIAARVGGRPLYDRLLTEADQAPNVGDRATLFEALGAFREPELVRRNLDLALGDTFDPRDTFSLITDGLGSDEARPLVWEWLRKNYGKLTGRRPPSARTRLLRASEAFCDEGHRREVAQFFTPKVGDIENGPRALANTLEYIETCARVRRDQAPSIETFLGRFTE